MGTEFILTAIEWRIAMHAPPHLFSIVTWQAKLFDMLPNSLPANTKGARNLSIRYARMFIAQFYNGLRGHFLIVPVLSWSPLCPAVSITFSYMRCALQNKPKL